MDKPANAADASPSRLIDAHIARLLGAGDWRGAVLAQVRGLIRDALPDMVETWKWDVPVWEHGGILCTGETYKQAVKLTFPKGASLPDPAGLFNASLEGATRRAIDLREGAAIDPQAFKALMQAAAAKNAAAPAKKSKKAG